MSTEPALLSDAAVPAPRPTNLFAGLARDWAVLFGAAVILAMVVLGVGAPFLGTVDPADINPTFRNRVPGVVFVSLYGIAILAACFTGYSGWTEAQRSRVSDYLMGFVIAGVILLIQDLDRPGTGLISVSQQPIIDTIKSIASYTPAESDR